MHPFCSYAILSSLSDSVLIYKSKQWIMLIPGCIICGFLAAIFGQLQGLVPPIPQSDIKVEAFVRTGCSGDQVTNSPWILSCGFSGIDIENISSIHWIRYIPNSKEETPLFGKHEVLYNWKPGQVQRGALLDLKNRVDAVTFTNNCLKLKIKSLTELDKRHWECHVHTANEDEPQLLAFKDVSRACVDNIDPDDIKERSTGGTTTTDQSQFKGSASHNDNTLKIVLLSTSLALLVMLATSFLVAYCFRQQLGLVKDTNGYMLKRNESEISSAQVSFGERRSSDDLSFPLLQPSEGMELRKRGAGASSASQETNLTMKQLPKRDHIFKQIKAGYPKEAIIERLTRHPEEADQGWGWEQSTPLMEAARLGRADIVQILIQGGVDVNKQDESKYSALIWAAIGNQSGTAQQLLSAGANVRIFNHTRASSVMYAASAKDPCVLALFLDTMSPEEFKEANVKDSYGNAPLHWSSYRGRTEQCIMLCAAGAEHHLKKKGFDQKDPYELAVSNGHEETAKCIKQMLENISRKRSNAQMYLHIAVIYGIQSMVETWLSKAEHTEDLKMTDGTNLSDVVGTKNVYCYPNTKHAIRELLKKHQTSV